MLHKAWNSKGEMPYRFPRSSFKFQGHTVQNFTDFDPNWAFPDYRPVAAFKSLRFALFTVTASNNMVRMPYLLILGLLFIWPSVRPLDFACASIHYSCFPLIDQPSVCQSVHSLSSECTEGMTLNFACWCIMTTIATDKILVILCCCF